MKFLFVGTNPEHTGAATHFVALAQAMAQAGHEVSAVVYPDGLISHGLAQSNVQIHHARFRNIFDLRGYRAVFAVAKKQKPDWLIGNFGKEYWPLILCGRLLGVKVALFRHRTPAMSRVSGYFLPRLADRFSRCRNTRSKPTSTPAFRLLWCRFFTTRSTWMSTNLILRNANKLATNSAYPKMR
jgi:hypothetical protein